MENACTHPGGFGSKREAGGEGDFEEFVEHKDRHVKIVVNFAE